MQYDYSKLLGRIVEIAGTQSEFSSRMGLSERSVSLKINGIRPWKQFEIEKACTVLSIPPREIPVYFFNPKVQRLNFEKGEMQNG